MLFSEKMTLVPQPHRAELWGKFRILGKALVLKRRLEREHRSPTEEELAPLRNAAKEANAILGKYHLSPSFFPENNDFFFRLTEELIRIRDAKEKGDDRHDSSPNE